MGSPLSPLLANIYLHALDCALVQKGWELVRYADDFIVQTRERSEVEGAYWDVQEILEELKLRYEPEKTSITSFEQGFEFLGVRFYRDTYSYVWQEKVITVDEDEVDWLFSRYGPSYE